MFYSKSKKARLWLLAGMLLPSVLVILVPVGAGLWITGEQSLGYVPLIGQTELSLDVYRELFVSRIFYSSLSFSLMVSLFSTLISAVLAVLMALWLRRYVNKSKWLQFLIQFNLPLPHVVGAMAIWMLLGQSGYLSRLAYWAGIIQEPAAFPVLVQDQVGAGIILEYIWKEVPFIAVSIISILKAWVLPYERQLRLLGASSWQRFRLVTFPFMLPPLLSSSIIVFAYTFGSFEVPYILGSVSQPALPILAYEAYTNPDLTYRPEAMAINMVITMISVVLVFLYLKWGEHHTVQQS
ncbi:ABC transporter permease [Paenibacillus sp. JSM ZJ436]|uniref:ABC transporter permease n=1 Tax=Paenibacillus sp. JSM ZJ436 TaxID=3376190 RepID=UPI0037ACD773